MCTKPRNLWVLSSCSAFSIAHRKGQLRAQKSAGAEISRLGRECRFPSPYRPYNYSANPQFRCPSAGDSSCQHDSEVTARSLRATRSCFPSPSGMMSGSSPAASPSTPPARPRAGTYLDPLLRLVEGWLRRRVVLQLFQTQAKTSHLHTPPVLCRLGRRWRWENGRRGRSAPSFPPYPSPGQVRASWRERLEAATAASATAATTTTAAAAATG